ncbi:MAG: hypothetical protein EBR54_04325 [Flavobacteriia bacterium]|nr:hypothetical protein [Flavobacteriia bacterium]
MNQLLSYSGTAYNIVNTFHNNGSSISFGGNSTSFGMRHLEYCELKDTASFLSSISTTVHETTHGLDSQIPYMFAKRGEKIDELNLTEGFYIDENIQYYLVYPKNPLFPSIQVVNEIPTNLRTLRFETYMVATPLQSTQSSGIIGLMEEFNAYYHGSKVVFDFLPLFKEKYPTRVAYKWSNTFISNADAYYEFDFFIKEYLLFAQSKHPDLYNELKNDYKFKLIYQTIRRNFGNMISQYEKKYDELVKTDKSGWSTSKHSDIYDTLNKQINSDRYLSIKSDFLSASP